MMFQSEPENLQPSFIGLFKNIKLYILAAILALIFVNLFILNLHSFFIASSKNPSLQQPIQPRVSQIQESVSGQTECTGSCLEKVKELIRLATSSAKNSSETASITSSSLIQNPAPTLTTFPTPTPTLNEYFVPLGTGYANYSTWKSIPGMSVTIDTSYYPNITGAIFEVLVWTPTGNQTVSVQLYNATTFQAVPGSTVTLSGGTPTLLTAPITLTSGINTYQVQMTTQLQYNSYIDMARIRIRTSNIY